MKKILSIIIIFLTFILIYLLQSNFFNSFTIARVKPNLFIILSLFIGIFIGKIYGGIIGIIFGLLLDIFIGKALRNKCNNTRNSGIYAEEYLLKTFQKTVE